MPKFSMSIDLNVLNHLGIKLYSSIPAVISEAVANAWDADAGQVAIDIAPEGNSIVISDDGHGMLSSEVNSKFLKVGYRRREDGGGVTPNGRKVLGRKGIGKLSLFSIADTIRVETVKNGEKSGLEMSLSSIEASITAGNTEYSPKEIASSELTVTVGTRITLTNLRKNPGNSAPALRRRIARRFSKLGVDSTFSVSVNGSEITAADREYYKKLEFIWTYGDLGKEVARISSAVKTFPRDAKFSGWIGTVAKSGDLISDDSDNLNDIGIFVRGRLAQEKTLSFFGEDGLYASYVVGEIHADWLDEDTKQDIATTSRQTLIEDDPRVIELHGELKRELKHIQNSWTSLRNEAGEKAALVQPAVAEWFGTLGSDQKAKARQLFGKINQLKLDEEQKKPLFKYAVLAFERLRLKDSLSQIDLIAPEDVGGYLAAFKDYDDLESQYYYEISKGRLDIIQKFESLKDDDMKEKVLQQFLFEHLWLLDPAWDRAATDPVMEVEVKKAVLNEEEFDGEYMEEIGRVDIQYRKSGGEHVIIELKRAGRLTDSDELSEQVRKYHRKMKRLLSHTGRTGEPYEIICVVGRDLKDWSEPRGREDSAEMLSASNARVMTYEQLIGNAKRAYAQYLVASSTVGRIQKVVESFDL